jgi:hypothetical protein
MHDGGDNPVGSLIYMIFKLFWWMLLAEVWLCWALVALTVALIASLTGHDRTARFGGCGQASNIRATFVPEQAGNCGRQGSLTDIANGLRSGHIQVDPLRETYF